MKKIAVSIHAIKDFNPDIIKGLEGLDYIHVDVTDGKFVEVEANNLEVFKILKETYDIPIIAHLMVKDPFVLIEKIIQYVDIFIFHYEAGGKRELIIKEVKKHNKKVAIAINPGTALNKILSYLNKIDMILLMSVIPGKSGQKFMWEVVDKVNTLFAYRTQNKLKFQIDIDGGINLENANFINSDIITSASTILNAEAPNYVIQKLKNLS